MRTRQFALLSFFCLTIIAVCQVASAKPEVIIPRPVASNLFSTEQAVAFDAEIAGFPAGEVEISAAVQDYFGQPVWSDKSARQLEGKKETVALNVGKPAVGYYLLKVTVTPKAGGSAVTQTASFGVAPFIHRTAKEVREGGYRFGLKKWGAGEPKGPNQWSTEDAVASSCNLGLQWTRDIFSQRGTMGLVDMVTRYPMNVAMKVERFPKELYDVQRYGPLEEWEKKFGRGAWTLKTLPQKEPYQQYLRQQLADIPADQNVFEIWNEAWDKMSPEDFATLCQWIVPVILEKRPDAIIGPNLRGDMSAYEFDARVIKAGGMKGMRMVALHPYATSEDRAWMRKYRQWMEDQTGQALDIYVTEFGSHSTPQGPAKRSEEEQAQRVVRQALALYAENVTAFMPHWMGQSEQNPTYIEDWFGFFRANRQVKPVLMAYAAAARMVDGSNYLGDLWYGPGSDAMLFEHKGVYTLALFTRGDEKEIDVAPGVNQLTVVNMVGGEKKQAIEGNKLHLKLSADVTYLVGVSADLAKASSKELRADRWPEPAKPPRVVRTATRFKSTFQPDGKVDEWQGMTQMALQNPKVAGDDASAMTYVAWDDQYLYVAVDVRDNEVLNNKPRAKLYQHDSIEFFLSTEPREEGAGYGPHDHQFFITPTSGEGHAIVGEVTDREAGVVKDVPNVKSFVGKAGKGWVAELAIPWTNLADFKPATGAKLAMEMRLNDADTSHERWKLDSIDLSGPVRDSNPSLWSYLVLGGTDAVAVPLPAMPAPVPMATPAATPAPAPAPKPKAEKAKPAAAAAKPMGPVTVAEWQFNGDQDLAGGAIVKLDATAPDASQESKLMPKSSYIAGSTGLGSGWKPFLASGYARFEKGTGSSSDNQHGLVIAETNAAAHNGQYRSFFGTGLGAAPKGGTAYLVIRPRSDWTDSRRGLLGCGYAFGRPVSSGAFALQVDQGQIFWRVGRGENTTQTGHTAPVMDLNADGDTNDYVYAESAIKQKWNPKSWYFIAVSWQEDAVPVLYVREMGDSPANSPKAVIGEATTAQGNIIATIPAKSGGPRYDPLTIGAIWNNPGSGRTNDGAEADIAYARFDRVFSTAEEMEKAFFGLAAERK